MQLNLQIEIDRLEKILRSNDLEFTLSAGSTIAEINKVEKQIGFTLDQDLKDLWLLTNGSNHELWFAVNSDEIIPCSFPSLEYSFEHWSAFLPYNNPTYEEYKLDRNECDERIQNTLIHEFWFPLAEFNGFSTGVIFDADPTNKGTYGQIIVYQHDPDGIYYVAENFLSFFKKSNDLLEKNFKEIFALDL